MDTSSTRKWVSIAMLFAAIAGGAFFATRGGSGASDEMQGGLQREEAMAPSADTAGDSGAALVSMGEASEEQGGQRDTVDAITVDERMTFSPKARGKSVTWIEGYVESPEGVPLDETLEVVAKGKVFKGTKDRREHRVPVEVDGSFRVAISADTAAARLSLIAKYQYLDDSFAWLRSEGGEAVLKPKLGARVLVQVVTEPLSQERLNDFSASVMGPWGWEGNTNPSLLDGNRLELNGMPSGKGFSLLARARGYARASVELEDLEAGKIKEVTIILKPEAIIAGRMVDNRGDPVPEGRIIPRMSGEGRWGRNMDSSDFAQVQDGQFEVHGLSAGDIDMYFSSQGFSADKLSVPNLRVGERREGLVWHANKGLSVRGKVIWPDGSPARHVSVKVVGMSQRELAQIKASSGGMGMGGGGGSKVETDADGLFEISGFTKAAQIELMAEGLPPDKPVPRDLSKIKKRRFRREHTVRVRMDKILVSGPEITLVLGEEQEPFRGRVEDDLGDPISTFRLIATPVKGRKTIDKKLGWGQGKGGVLRQRCKDEDGAFIWAGIPMGDWSIEATAAGYQKGEVLPVSTPSSKDVVFMLPRGARIFGKVVDPDDEKVMCEVRYARVVDGIVSERTDSVINTEPLGFSIDNLAPGTYRVSAREPLQGNSPAQTFQVGAGDVVDDVILRVPGPGSLSGTVHRDWWSEGLEVKLKPNRDDGARWGVDLTAKVRSDGTFFVEELAPGSYTGRLRGRFKVDSQRTVNSNPGPSQEVEVVAGQVASLHFNGAPAGSVRLKGRLLRDGEGVSGFKLGMQGMDPHRNEVECVSRAGGAYSIILAGSGTYRVRAHPADGGAEQVWKIDVGAGAQSMDLNLPSYSLTVVLTSQEGGPLPFEVERSTVSLQAVGLGGRAKIGAKSVTDNEVLFTGLASGSYQLKFNPRDRGWSRGVSSNDSPSKWVLADHSEIVLAEGETQKSVDRNLRMGASLTGRLTGTKPETSRFLYVSIALSEDGGNNRWARIQEDAFTAEGLPAGDVWVTCKGSGIEEEEPVKVTISYDSSASVSVPYPALSED
ncbi:MAG: hypothetical protein GY930_06835 [bacterium]|nr:hypothetical protein [bacterium]